MTRRPHDAPATSAAYVVYAATIAGLGVIGLVTGGFPSIWAPVPAAVPAHTALAYVTALIMVATGAGLLVPRLASRASRVLLAFVVAWLVLVRLPHMLLAWGVNTWWAACKSAVMASAAWAAARRAEPDASGVGLLRGAATRRIAHGLFGAAMIPFGVAHFLYMNATAPLVPHWLPGSGVFWGYLTGATFVAAGLAILLNVTARLATALVAAQMALLTLIIWVPPVARGPNPGQWQEFVTSWVLSACGWIVAESFRPGP